MLSLQFYKDSCWVLVTSYQWSKVILINFSSGVLGGETFLMSRNVNLWWGQWLMMLPAASFHSNKQILDILVWPSFDFYLGVCPQSTCFSGVCTAVYFNFSQCDKVNERCKYAAKNGCVYVNVSVCTWKGGCWPCAACGDQQPWLVM